MVEEGLPGFYKGMGAKMFGSVLGAAIMLMIKEKLVDATRMVLSNRKREERIT